jgi:PAS domain S-box-containing protein/putative nucleotidyltransferase with HDIG domain
LKKFIGGSAEQKWKTLMKDGMRRLILGLALIGFTLWSNVYTAAAQSVPPTQPPEADEVLIVGVDQNFPPYSYIDDGELKGFNVDLIRAVAQEMGFEVEIRAGEWSQVRADLADKSIDLVAGMAYSSDRDAFYDFSVPFAYLGFDLFVPAQSSAQSLQDLTGKRILLQSAGIMSEYLQNQQFQADIVGVQDAATAMRLLSGGDYDAALLNRLRGEYLIRSLDIKNVKRVGASIVQQKYGFAVAEGNKELLAKLNEGLYLVSASGKLDELQEKWFGVYTQPASTTHWPWIALAITAGLALCGAFVWLGMLGKQMDRRTRELARSEERNRLMVNNLVEGVVITRLDTLVYANPAAARAVDLPVEGLVGKPLTDLIHPDDVALVFDCYQRMLRGEKTPLNLTFRLLTARKDSRWVQMHSIPFQWNDEPGALAMFMDITEQRQSEEEVRKQLRYIAALRAVEMAIAANMDLSLTLRVLLEQVITQLHVDAASILLYDSEAQELVYGAGQGFQHSYPREFRLSPGSGLAGMAVAKRKMVRSDDLANTGDSLWTAERAAAESFCAYVAMPLISQSAVVGVLEIFQRRPLDGDLGWTNFLEALANQAAIALENARLLENLQQANTELILAYDATISGWARAMEMRDGETEGHSQRVTSLAIQVASEMGIHGDALVQIRRGALLHDIGKMAIPDSILKKKENLTEDEWEIMRLHPAYAVQMLSSIEFLKPAIGIPKAHHEWWDGSGYPEGLRGEQIPIEARIFSVVDVWDALVTERRYRKSWPQEKVLAHIRGLSGRQFDPQVVEIFSRLVETGRLRSVEPGAD